MNDQYSITSFIKKIPQVHYCYFLLIAWTIIGFFFRWDNNMQVGCNIQSDNILGQDNIFFSATSIILLTLGVSFQRNNERIWFLFFELLYWLLKLFYWKGGYGVGIGGIPIFTVVFFDMIALFLRIMLLNATLEFKFANNYILIPLFIFFYVKLYFFQ
jgi:hypothetical protein